MGKKSKKQYRKLMAAYERFFGFHKPYQVIVDAEFVQDFVKRKDDLEKMLKITLQGDVKPMITQCSIRHLYALKTNPSSTSTPASKSTTNSTTTASLTPQTIEAAIDLAKSLERRFCGHKPEDFPEPLSTLECLSAVVDVHGRNKHRYVVASQEKDLRRRLREVVGVPLVYVEQGVTKLEPMASASCEEREREERGKFRAELKGRKRKAGDEEGGEEEEAGRAVANDKDDGGEGVGGDGKTGGKREPPQKKRKKNYGKAKGPNPLSVKKRKKAADGGKP